MVATNEMDSPTPTTLDEQLAAVSLSPSVSELTRRENLSEGVAQDVVATVAVGDAQASAHDTTGGSHNNDGDEHAVPCRQVQNKGDQVNKEPQVRDVTNSTANNAANVDIPSKTETFLLEHSPEFRRLYDLRKQGWSRPEGDAHFAHQRHRADNASLESKHFFYTMMQRIGSDMHASTHSALLIPPSSPSPSILDLCCAPGGFLSTALTINPSASALGLTLPAPLGGHDLLIPKDTPNLTVKFLDITMLASDMGVLPEEIPPSHPDAKNFLPRMFPADQRFDLIFCDGQVLRKHERAEYRATQARERRRITLTQLVIGLEHVREGGTMVVLLHKLDEGDTVRWLGRFESFADVRLYKHERCHASRSAFYMVARGVRSEGKEVGEAVEEWKREWRVATFGSEEEFEDENRRVYGEAEEEVLKEFGAKLVEKGRKVWDIQARALERATWMSGGGRRQWA